MSAGFHIFQLPAVALEQTIDLFEIQDLVLLSSTSRNAFNAIKYNRTRRSDLGLTMNCFNYRVELRSIMKSATIISASKKDDDMPNEGLSTMKIRGHTVSMRRVPVTIPGFIEYPTTYWDDPSVGFRIIVDFVQDLLRVDLHSLWINRSSLWALDWVNERQNVLMNLRTHPLEELTVEEYDMIMKKSSAKRIFLLSRVQHEFSYTGGLENREFIHMRDGHWMKVETFLQLNCQEMLIDYSSFTNNDVNLIIKHWMAGKLPNLKILKTHVEPHPNSEVIYAGLEHYFVEAKPGRTIKSDWLFGFRGDKYLRRSDGTTASIEIFFNTFTMVVWSDTSG